MNVLMPLGANDSQWVFTHYYGLRKERRAVAPSAAKPALRKKSLPAMWSTVIGKKITMAVSGTVMVLFVFAHMLGNLKIFSGPQNINIYARFLREAGQPELGYGDVLWVVRSILLVSVMVHITAAFQLTRLNWQARPEEYRMRRNLAATLASRTMPWGGLCLAVFVVFHLLHFTGGVVAFRPGQFRDLAVYQNVLIGFSVWPVASLYILAMVALGLHIDHGIWSAAQTLGWGSARNERTIRMLSRLIAAVLFAGFISVPFSVMAGWVH